MAFDFVKWFVQFSSRLLALSSSFWHC